MNLPTAPKVNGELGDVLSVETVPALIMERLTDIRNLAVEVRNLKIFAAPSEESIKEVISSIEIGDSDHPLIQIMKKTAQTYYKCKSEAIQRELLSELRELLAEQHRREIEAMKEANRLLIEYAKIRSRGKGGSSVSEDAFLAALKVAEPG